MAKKNINWQAHGIKLLGCSIVVLIIKLCFWVLNEYVFQFELTEYWRGFVTALFIAAVIDTVDDHYKQSI